jgi:alginate O-acetyltransferase complex protein AlgI
LREYLYYPLGGNRTGPVRTYLNLMIVMTLGGLWHGAAWSYAVWGIWHGAALIGERAARGTRFYAHSHWTIRGVRMALVFTVVTWGWLLFKLPHFSDAVAYIGSL